MARSLALRLRSQNRPEKMNPRSIGTPMTAGVLPLAGFDRSFRHHDVRGLIDFPFPCRTVSTQVLLYVERLVVSSDLTTISAGAELPPSCLRMASHRRPSRPSNDRCSRTQRQCADDAWRRQSRTFPETLINERTYQLRVNLGSLARVDNHRTARRTILLRTATSGVTRR
jgi:hypothetical protein